jgi:hypothetical protein
MLVPYYSLRHLIQQGVLPLLPVQQVCIGPGIHKQINSESAKALLQKFGYSAVSVDVSKTSYRA